MITVDTTVPVRVLTNDDPPQAARAMKLFDRALVKAAKKVDASPPVIAP
jgi:predicted nucleic acid-binding protein